ATDSSGPHHGYLTMSTNLFDANPVFTSVQVDADNNPLAPNGAVGADPPLPGQNPANCTGCRRARHRRVPFEPGTGRPSATLPAVLALFRAGRVSNTGG